MGRHRPMSKDASARIQSAADRHRASRSATSGFARRAQSAADTRADSDRDKDHSRRR